MLVVLYMIFNKVVKLSIEGCIVVLSILLIKKILKSNVGIRLQYSFWFVLIFSLLFPITPSSNFGIYRGASFNKSEIINTSSISQSINTMNNFIIESPSAVNVIDRIPSFRMILLSAWICGALTILFTLLISNKLFINSIKKGLPIEDESVLKLFQDCKTLMKIDRNISLVRTKVIKTPCVINFLKPTILIPENSLEECNLTELKYIFLHELSHIKRKDILINYIVSFLCIIYWFNPLIWYGFYRMREDREICCDSLALSFLKDKDVKNYGFAIIKQAEISSRRPNLPAMAGIINSKSKIEKRIKMIKSFKKNSYRVSLVALVALIIAGGALLTGVKEVNADTNIITNKLSQEIVDKIDYPFVNDDEVIGKWEAVDYIKEISEFDVNSRKRKDDLYLKSINLLPNGQMTKPICKEGTIDETTPVPYLTWTNGYIIHHGDKTTARYTIKEINGEKYMFWEWKSGDYTILGRKPYYYVLKQVQ